MRFLAKVLLFLGVFTLSLAYPYGRRFDILPAEDREKLESDDFTTGIEYDDLDPKDREIELQQENGQSDDDDDDDDDLAKYNDLENRLSTLDREDFASKYDFEGQDDYDDLFNKAESDENVNGEDAIDFNDFGDGSDTNDEIADDDGDRYAAADDNEDTYDVVNDRYKPMKQLDQTYYDTSNPAATFAGKQHEIQLDRQKAMLTRFNDFETANLDRQQPSNKLSPAIPPHRYDTLNTMAHAPAGPTGYRFGQPVLSPDVPSQNHHHHHHEPVKDYAQGMYDSKTVLDHDKFAQPVYRPNSFGNINHYNTGKRLLSIDTDEEPMTGALRHDKSVSEDRMQALSPTLKNQIGSMAEKLVKAQSPKMLKLALNGGLDF